jgi:hypothetical protein
MIRERYMVKQSVVRRIVVPIALVLGVMIVSINLYDLTPRVLEPPWHSLLANGSAVLMFASIWMGALFANTMAYFRGATFRERLLVCLITPLVWSAKTWSDFFGIYSPWEILFALLHHLILGAPIVALLGMGLSEIWCRAIHKIRLKDDSVRILGAANVSVLLIGLISTVLMLWNGGHDYYYLYMDLYTYLFL